MSHTTYLLLILDGFGYREAAEDNAISQADTPTWDRLWQSNPRGLISGSGLDVGLPDGQMGNSEVGHMNLGAGRVVDQDFTRISKAIGDGSFFTNPLLTTSFEQLAQSGKALHIFGLLSPGGVHSHEDHLSAAIKMAFDEGVQEVYLHAFLDGRDVPPKSADSSIRRLDAEIKSRGPGGIATIMGRYFAMDRDNRWDRVEAAYDAITSGNAAYHAETAIDGLMAAYDRNETDEFVKPTTTLADGKPIKDGDGILFMNFRADRAREITRAFTDKDFSEFNRKLNPDTSFYITLTKYAEDIEAPCVFEPGSLDMGLGEFISSLNKTQLRIAETEKYAHVTFFFSGGREAPFSGEDRLLVPSPDVATYDLQPEMSAPLVTDEIVAAISSDKYDVIICNYANGDMVGHTGNLAASILAVECLDHCISRIEEALTTHGGHALITADHGNVEQMNDHTTGQAHTAHTSEPVPLIYMGSEDIQIAEGGTLSDIAPTILSIMGLEQPHQMTGRSLVVKQANKRVNQS